MPKLRKMLGDANSENCQALMKLIETQNKTMLAQWAINYAKSRYLPIYEKILTGEPKLRSIVNECEHCLEETKSPADIKLLIKEAQNLAKESVEPVAQAAAKAISVACAVLTTPTNALGFLFYGAAAVAYFTAGLNEKQAVYNILAADEFQYALISLSECSIKDDPNPVKVKWYC